MNVSAYRGLSLYQSSNPNLTAVIDNSKNYTAVSSSAGFSTGYTNVNPTGYTEVYPAGQNQDINKSEILSAKNTGAIECSTCEQRRYQDRSSDAGVSFKSPGHISPEASASVVMSHEQEHVRNEAAKASGESRKIISQSVTLKTSTCPECGRVYVSGGETRTVTKNDNSNQNKDYFSTEYKKILNKNFGTRLDVRV